MSVKVRPALEADVPWMLKELDEFARWYGTKRSLFGDLTRAHNNMTETVKNHVAYIAEKDGERVGLVAGLLTPHLYNSEIKVLTEMFWWVTPKHRKSRAALMLMQRFITHGKDRADWVVFSTSVKSPIKPAALVKRGFREFETSYLMEVN